MSKQYVPVKCSMNECAFPYMTCDQCTKVAAFLGKKAIVFKNPKSVYQWVRNLGPRNRR